MHQLYLKPFNRFILFLLLTLITTSTATQAQGLEFRNSQLEKGTAGLPGAEYRFPYVTKDVDAIIKITDRSSSKVKLVSIDLTGSGWDKAFQPQVTYNNNETPNGQTDWWMEFRTTELPITLSAFTAKKADSKVVLNWSTEMEKDASHFVIERSLNGTSYTDAGLIFTFGNSAAHREYSFTDDLKQVSDSIVYYRLKMVDLDGRYERSAVRIIRLAEEKGGSVSILAYPNPVMNELHVTLPGSWQDKPLMLEIMNASGQVIRHLVQDRAGQTQTIQVSDLAMGMYIVRASNGSEMAVQKIVKK